MKRLSEMKEKHEVIGDTRRIELFIEVEIARNKKMKERGERKLCESSTRASKGG
jgi:4-aminobutyrate aminotransferase-like enzyme